MWYCNLLAKPSPLPLFASLPVIQSEHTEQYSKSRLARGSFQKPRCYIHTSLMLFFEVNTTMKCPWLFVKLVKYKQDSALHRSKVLPEGIAQIIKRVFEDQNKSHTGSQCNFSFSIIIIIITSSLSPSWQYFWPNIIHIFLCLHTVHSARPGIVACGPS